MYEKITRMHYQSGMVFVCFGLLAFGFVVGDSGTHANIVQNEGWFLLIIFFINSIISFGV